MNAQVIHLGPKTLCCDYCAGPILALHVREFITFNAQEYLVHAECVSKFWTEVKRALYGAGEKELECDIKN